MKIKNVFSLMALAAFLFLIAGCGDGGGGGGGVVAPPLVDPNAAATVTATTSKTLALANDSDLVTVTADVTKNAGGPVADGTVVNFDVATGTATLSSATATTTGGTATVTVKHLPVAAPGINETITMTATAGIVTSAPVSAKFINVPASANVQLATTNAVSDIAALVFNLIPGNGATYNLGSMTAINEAAAAIEFDNVSQNQYSLLDPSLPTGFTTVAGKPILEFTFTINAAITALPVFGMQGTVTANHADTTSFNPALNTNDFIITTVFDTE